MTTRTEPGMPLTARELEVARLMTLGLRNKQIAEKLFISKRTVDTHLQNAYAKTRTGNRTQLSRWLWSVTR
jgi:DNA-binding CsgD family transcriptional regulator